MQARKAMLVLHGKQAMNDELRDAVHDMRDSGWVLDVRVTWEAGDAQRLVTEALAAGYSHIVAGGGDGTLRDVAEAMGQAGTDASLVLLPLGTANDFAKAAGIPLEPAAALALLNEAAQPIDLGQAGDQLFLNMATGGFGSQVTANTSEDLEEGPGRRGLSVHRPHTLQRTAGGLGRAARAGFPLARGSAGTGYRQWPPGGRRAGAVPGCGSR